MSIRCFLGEGIESNLDPDEGQLKEFGSSFFTGIRTYTPKQSVTAKPIKEINVLNRHSALTFGIFT